MNILVIGNGFDLAHGLPTKYWDFMLFIKSIKILKTRPKDKATRLINSGLENLNSTIKN